MYQAESILTLSDLLLQVQLLLLRNIISDKMDNCGVYRSDDFYTARKKYKQQSSCPRGHPLSTVTDSDSDLKFCHQCNNLIGYDDSAK